MPYVKNEYLPTKYRLTEITLIFYMYQYGCGCITKGDNQEVTKMQCNKVVSLGQRFADDLDTCQNVRFGKQLYL